MSRKFYFMNWCGSAHTIAKLREGKLVWKYPFHEFLEAHINMGGEQRLYEEIPEGDKEWSLQDFLLVLCSTVKSHVFPDE